MCVSLRGDTEIYVAQTIRRSGGSEGGTVLESFLFNKEPHYFDALIACYTYCLSLWPLHPAVLALIYLFLRSHCSLGLSLLKVTFLSFFVHTW